jgi:hypothetical protein
VGDKALSAIVESNGEYWWFEFSLAFHCLKHVAQWNDVEITREISNGFFQRVDRDPVRKLVASGTDVMKSDDGGVRPRKQNTQA